MMLSEEKISFDIRSEIVNRLSSHVDSGWFEWGRKEYMKEHRNITEFSVIYNENHFNDDYYFKENLDSGIYYLTNRLYSLIKREARAGYIYIGKVNTEIDNLPKDRIKITSSVEFGFDNKDCINPETGHFIVYDIMKERANKSEV